MKVEYLLSEFTSTEPAMKENFSPENTNTSNQNRSFVLFMLTAVYVFNFVDRQILVILQESIKQDLNLSDTQLGLMTGFSFAIFYVSFGIPIAKMADKGNRRNIVSYSLLLWSLMTALSGRAISFIQLLAARIGVGIGEAGGSPPSHAMISDLYPPQKRATAMAIYTTGISVGVLLGLLIGGFVNQAYGWRMSFYLVGIPGIIFAIIFRLTVKEPKRIVATQKSSDEHFSILEVARFMFKKKAFLWMAIGSGLSSYVQYSIANWFPPFLARIHGMTSAEIGLWLSILFGFGGGIGYFMGGFLTDKFRTRGMKFYLKFPAYAVLLGTPLLIFSVFADSQLNSLIFIAVPCVTSALYLAPVISLTHGLVKPRMRATASALLFFILNIIGLGFGPLLTGIISDQLYTSMGEDAIRWALAHNLLPAAIAFICYLLASKSISDDLELNEDQI